MTRRQLARTILVKVALLCLVLGAWGRDALAVDDHVLLCEAVLTPTDGEFIEIVNPTAATVPLDNYYLSDDEDYALLPGAFGAGPPPSISQFDFVVQFPPEASIPPCGVLIIAIDGAGFFAEFDFEADFEIKGTHSGTPDMLLPLGLGSQAGLTDAGESATLFFWDGASDLVLDVDMTNLGTPSDANDIGDKTGLSVDGPDPDSVASTYLPDLHTMPVQVSDPGVGESAKRALPEGINEVSAGGNGLSGDDETTEEIDLTWGGVLGFTAPNPGRCSVTLECYYAAVDWTNAATARQTIHELIDDHLRTPYSSDLSWQILETADQDPNDEGRILDVYKNASYAKVGGGAGPYEREHTWPDSYGFPNESGTAKYPRSDYHAIFCADSSYNGSRSNLPYDTCSSACDEKPTEANNGQGGASAGEYPGDSNWRTGSGPTGTWETWTGDLGGRRGDVARAVLYMDVRYDGSDHMDGSPEPDLILTDDRDLITSDNSNPQDPAYMGILSAVLQWHDQDPPDLVELWRNEAVSIFQENRNPFIDHPEWVRCVWGGVCAEIFVDGFEAGDTSAWSGSVP